MRIVTTLLLLLMIVGVSACRGSLQQNASSSIKVYNNTTSALIADSDTRGAITMHVGDTHQLRVMRTVVDQAEGTTTTNVTTDADYNSSDTSIVTVGQNDTNFAGLVTATGVGTASVEVVVHDPEDPTTDDTAAFDINVLP